MKALQIYFYKKKDDKITRILSVNFTEIHNISEVIKYIRNTICLGNTDDKYFRIISVIGKSSFIKI